MAINKVVYGGETLIDLTNDTVTADKLLQGYTAHDKAGNAITGTATQSGGGGISIPSPIVAGDTPVMGDYRSFWSSSKNEQASGHTLTISKAGQYKFIAFCGANGDVTFRLKKNNTQFASGVIDSKGGTLTGTTSCNAGDTITVTVEPGSAWRNGGVYGLIACIEWDNGF